MIFEETPLADLYLIKPCVFEDERGYFFESFNKQQFNQLGLSPDFVQDNQSLSHKNVIRGLHFQLPPFEQGKLVRVVNGSVNDVVVDIRLNSPTFGKAYSAVLSATNKIMMWIPPGFAHGFHTLEDNTLFIYKCTHYYNKESERGIRWDDNVLSIDWGATDPIVSVKDKALPTWQEYWS
jgi:dTDP-4-dehydrorhamnose 3,5-epimerase